MFGICKHLNLIPMCVFRMAIGFEKYARKIWEDTLLPIQASNFLSEKAERLFLKWHEKNI